MNKKHFIFLNFNKDGIRSPGEIFRDSINYDTINLSQEKRFHHKKNKQDAEKTVIYLENLKIGVAIINETQIKKLLKDDGVYMVLPNEEIHLQLPKKNNSTIEQKINWGIKKMIPSESSLSGKNINIAMLDTGVDRWHPLLKNKIKQKISYVPYEQKIIDKSGHGTHCTGIACGDFVNGNRIGLAYKSNLFICKVIDKNEVTKVEWVVKGLEWAIQNKCNIANLSISKKTKKGDRLITEYKEVVDRALKNDLIIVAAVGNDSARKGQKPDIHPIGAPSNIKDVIAVSAIDKDNNLFSGANGSINENQNVDYVAPGVNIYSTVPKSLDPSRYGEMTGTSMAAPFITGIIALLMEKHKTTKPSFILDKLKMLVKPGAKLNDRGKGLPSIH